MAVEEKAPALVCVTCKRTFATDDIKLCPDDRTLLVRPKADANIGTVLSGLYEIVSTLGRGGTSVVYKARHQLMDRLVAIKMLLWSGDTIHDDKKIRRFQQEARTTSRLNHPNIATLYDFGISPHGQPYLVMEYLEGQSLEDIIMTDGRLPYARAVDVFTQICDAMEHAHHKGIVHRDLKPSNVLVYKDEDGRDVVKIVDFGIAELMPNARQDTHTLGNSQQVLGSPLYMSPEHCLNKNIDTRTDIYCVGVSLFQALTGHLPFDGETIVEVIHKHIHEQPPLMKEVCPDADIPEVLEQAVVQCLKKTPAKRHQSMNHLKQQLLRVVQRREERESRFIRMSRVLVVCDDEVAVDNATRALEKFEDVCVVGVCTKGSEGIAEAVKQNPDIALVDLILPDMSGVEAIRQLRQQAPKVHLIVASDLENETDILSALRAGAEGFISKKFEGDNLPLALKAVGEGTIWLDPNVQSDVLDAYRQSAPDLIERMTQAPRRVDRPDDMSFLMSLAQSFADDKRFEEAEALYRIALELLERTRKPTHAEVFKCALKLGDTYFAQSKFSQAEPLYIQAAQIQTQVLGPDHPNIATVLEKIGKVYIGANNYEQAERYYYWAFCIREKALPADALKMAATCEKLADVYRHQQKFGQSEQYAQLAEKYKVQPKEYESDNES
jgi:serine/threonine protein kinase/tetratricopeptide (TPR) repeat protein